MDAQQTLDLRTLEAQEILPLVYDELRALARARLAHEATGHSLEATALVHEAYLRLSGSGARFANRAHFFAAAAESIRRILIEHARSKKRKKRGGGNAKRVALDVRDLAELAESGEILVLDDAIERLAEVSPLGARVVRLRFYAGLSVDEAAETLGVSPRTVDREWVYARAWLYRFLESGSA